MGRLIAALGALAVVTLTADGAEPPQPKLAVVVVFDQMRGDYLARWQSLFVDDGFRRLQSSGAWFSNCHYPYAITQTGPGHASLLSGCAGNKHGIVANNWYDRAEAAAVYCASSPRFDRIPPVVPEPAKTSSDEKKDDDAEQKKPKGVGAPIRMLAPTLADVIKEATDGKGKVFGLSLKDRSALLPSGRHPDGCYWFEKGLFVTSTYYGDRLHPWVARFNDEQHGDRWFGQQWTRLRANLNYEQHSGPDEGPGEGKGSNQGVTFPHPMGAAKTIGSEYYSALANSPFGNDLLLQLALRCIESEKLGRRDAIDLLTISFSSNDLVGHCWGPDSQEVLDITLRSDLIVRDLLNHLDKHVGKGNYVLALSADHGICPVPEVSASRGEPGKRIAPTGMLTDADEHLREKFGRPADARTRWIEMANEGGIYLNRRLVAARGYWLDDVAAELADWLRRQPFIHAAFTQAQLRKENATDDDLIRQMRLSFMGDRSGDVLIVPKPNHIITTATTGTTHGAPHAYDTHVPLVVFGPGIRGGERKDRVTPLAMAAILARALGVAPPAKAEYPVPSKLFED